MGKYIIGIIVGIVLIVSLLGLFSFMFFGLSMQSGTGSYTVIGSNGVNEVTFEADVISKEMEKQKIHLESNNTIEITNFRPGGRVFIKINDSAGTSVFSEEIKGDAVFNFSANSGEGELEITFFKGKHQGIINIE